MRNRLWHKLGLEGEFLADQTPDEEKRFLLRCLGNGYNIHTAPLYAASAQGLLTCLWQTWSSMSTRSAQSVQEES